MSISRLCMTAGLVAAIATSTTAAADETNVTVPDRPTVCVIGDAFGIGLPGCGPIERPTHGPQGDDLPSNPTDS